MASCKSAYLLIPVIFMILVGCESRISEPAEEADHEILMVQKPIVYSNNTGDIQGTAHQSQMQDVGARYYCLVSTLNPTGDEWAYTRRRFDLRIPLGLVKQAKKEGADDQWVSFQYGHPDAAARTEADTLKDVGLVRMARCMLPPSVKVRKKMEKQLAEFGPGSWLSQHNRQPTSAANTPQPSPVQTTTGYYVCSYVFITSHCSVNPDTGELYNCRITNIECTDWKYVYVEEEGDDTGGGDDTNTGEPCAPCEPNMPCSNEGGGPGGTPQGCEPEDDSGGSGPGGLDPPSEPCIVTAEDLNNVFSNSTNETKNRLSSLINEHSEKFGIDTKEKLQHFLAHTGHETGGFKSLNVRESLYYTTASRLVKVWPYRFSQTDPNLKDPDNYLENEEKLANLVYSNRMGNGSPESGDGWKYRGRGIMQLTGQNNYSAFTTFYQSNFNSSLNFVNNPELIKTDDNLAVLSGMWHFKENILDADIQLDGSDEIFKLVTDIIRNSSDSWDERKQIYDVLKNNIDCEN